LPFAFCLAGYIRNDRVHHHFNKKTRHRETRVGEMSRRDASAF
jgi:hypothetical protein